MIHRLEGHLTISMERMKETLVRRLKGDFESNVGYARDPSAPSAFATVKWSRMGTGGFVDDVVAVVVDDEEVVEP